ncbi:MAG: cysteine--tRNA ligase [Chitinophagales bacterium]
MTIQLYDTLTRRKRDLVPRRPGELAVYVCGVTPYAYTHVGHARVSVLWDVFRRYFTYRGYTVKFAQNFTDVDDKIIARAQKEGLPAWKLAQRYIDDYHEVMAKLQVAPADLHPRVTTEIDTIIAFVQGLIDKGHAYPAGGDVFYRVGSFPGYGKLSGRSLEEMEAGARIEVNPLKENPMDFALWKAAKEGEPAWESPWGPGRPGWHIECSAMSLKYLGEAFDIHGGGLDLVFPHHENEVAQSEALTGAPLARYWLHNGMVNVAEEKMSKSLGNTFAVRDVLEVWDPLTVRYFLISAQYRSPLTYSETELKAADQARRRLENLAGRLSAKLAEGPGASDDPAAAARLRDAARTAREDFVAAMDDDLNTALALAALQTLAREVNRALDEAAGVGQELHAALREVREVFAELDDILRVIGQRREAAEAEGSPDAAAGEAFKDVLLALRQTARETKNWALADQIRDGLKAKGITVKDTPGGTVVEFGKA